ncbi:MFS transporter [Antribacter gilvus]|uniref:MFS transporter n=1 Tax=Antribacter gilvus TaxID=2304675 RepID=UPI000F7A9CEF|nr:MFS transporter [Antribacter gilvus]
MTTDVLPEAGAPGAASTPTSGQAATPTSATSDRAARTAWAGIAVMMSTSFVLVLAEFLPPGLLTLMAGTLGVTEGQAGQAVTATAIAGFFTAPTIGLLFPRLDRRTLLSVLTVAAAVSSLLVAISANLWLLLLARLLLGAALGGFWAMSLAVAARLAAPQHLGRALMLVNTGTTVATVAGVPLGAYLGSILDWRFVFAGVAVLTAIVAGALRVVLPPVAPAATTGVTTLVETFRVPGMALGLAGHVLTIIGHFAAFAYIRLAFGEVPGLDAAGIAVMLVVFGVGGVVGNAVIGLVIDKHLRAMRYAVPLLIGTGVVLLAVLPGVAWVVYAAVGAWGFAFGAWLMVVTTWMGRLAPTRMEAGGGLLVAGFQLAITVGAGVGGLLVDSAGIQVALIAAAVSALVGGFLFGSAPEREEAPLDSAR